MKNLLNLFQKEEGSEEEKILEATNLDTVLSKNPLSDEETWVDPITITLNEQEWSFFEKDLKLKVEGQYNIQLFNQTKDEDEDEFISNEKDSFLTFNADKPYLKHKLHLKSSSDFSATIPKTEISVGFKHGLDIQLLGYRLHDADDTVMQALKRDVTHFATVMSLEDILTLEEGEAVGYKYTGNMSGSVQVELSDAISKSVSSLIEETASATGLLEMDATVGAELGATFSIEDTFQLMILRTKEEFKVSLNKAAKKTGEVKGDLGLTIKVTSLDGAREKAKAWLGDSLSNFGLQDTLLDKLEEKLEEEIKASLTLSYSRIKTEEALMVAELDQAKVTEFHKDLLQLNLNPVVEAARANESGVTINKYESKLIVKETIQMGLNLFGLVKFNASSSYENIHEATLDGAKDAFIGKVMREADLLQRFFLVEPLDRKTTVTFAAEMSDYKSQPKFSDFQQSLTMELVGNSEKKGINRAAFRRETYKVLDNADAWGIFKNTNKTWLEAADEVWKLLKANGQEGKADDRPTFKLSFSMDKEGFKSVLDKLDALDAARPEINRQWVSQGLGRSMPFWEELDLRQKPDEKSSIYGQVFERFLKDFGWTLNNERMPRGERPLSDYSTELATLLVKNGLNRAAKKEKNSNDFESFKEVIGYLKEKMLDTAFTSAQEGFDLMEKLQENSNLTQTRRWKEAFKNTESAFGEWQFIVALGNYFHRLAGDEFKKWTKAKLEVAYVKDGKTHVKSYENK